MSSENKTEKPRRRRIIHGEASKMAPPKPETEEERLNRRSEQLSERRAERRMEAWYASRW